MRNKPNTYRETQHSLIVPQALNKAYDIHNKGIKEEEEDKLGPFEVGDLQRWSKPSWMPKFLYDSLDFIRVLYNSIMFLTFVVFLSIILTIFKILCKPAVERISAVVLNRSSLKISEKLVNGASIEDFIEAVKVLLDKETDNNFRTL